MTRLPLILTLLLLAACAASATTATPTTVAATPTEAPARFASELIDLSAAVRAGGTLPAAVLDLPGVEGAEDQVAALLALEADLQAQAREVSALAEDSKFGIYYLLVANPDGPDEYLSFAKNPETGEMFVLNRLVGDAGQEVRQEINGLWSGRVAMGEGGTFAEAEYYYLLGGQEVPVMRWNGQNFVFIGNDGTEMVLPGITFRLGRSETQGVGVFWTQKVGQKNGHA